MTGHFSKWAAVILALSAGLDGGFSQEAKPSNEAVLEALERIERRIDALESRLEALESAAGRPTAPQPGKVRVYVLGEVRKPGQYLLQDGDGVLNLLAAAGGATNRADLKRVTIDRRGEPRLKVNARGEGTDQPLKAGDVVTVPESFF